VAITAIKALQDMEDLKQVDLSPFWQDESLIENPNNEDIELLKLFYKRNLEFYKAPEKLKLEDYYDKLVITGVDAGVSARVLSKAREYAADPQMMSSIKTIYDSMIVE
jgi:hypothetical protein